MTTTANPQPIRVEIFKDAYDGAFKIDYHPESHTRDRRSAGYRTLRDAREIAVEHGAEWDIAYRPVYVGER